MISYNTGRKPRAPEDLTASLKTCSTDGTAPFGSRENTILSKLTFTLNYDLDGPIMTGIEVVKQAS